MGYLASILFNHRPDLLNYPLGSSWQPIQPEPVGMILIHLFCAMKLCAADDVIGIMLWMDGRKFRTERKPPAHLRRWKDNAGKYWMTNNEGMAIQLHSVVEIQFS